MSWQAFQAVRDYSEVTDNTGRLIMYTIASYCNEYGNMDNAIITPSYQTIADGAACHRQTVKNWLHKLVASGELNYKTEKIKGSKIKKMTRFTINLPMSQTSLEYEDMDENYESQTKLDLLQRIEELEQKLDNLISLLPIENDGDYSTTEVQHEYNHSCTHKDNKDNKDKQPSNDVATESQSQDIEEIENDTQQPSVESNELQDPEITKTPIELASEYTIDELRKLEYNQQHPVSLVWINVNHRSMPKKLIQMLISEILAIKKFDGEVLKYVCNLWDATGYNPTNYIGKVECYIKAMNSSKPLEWKFYNKSKQNTGWTNINEKANTDWT